MKTVTIAFLLWIFLAVSATARENYFAPDVGSVSWLKRGCALALLMTTSKRLDLTDLQMTEFHAVNSYIDGFMAASNAMMFIDAGSDGLKEVSKRIGATLPMKQSGTFPYASIISFIEEHKIPDSANAAAVMTAWYFHSDPNVSKAQRELAMSSFRK